MKTRQQWSDAAIRRLLDRTSCPVCGLDAFSVRGCANCGVQLPDELATELWEASQSAALALAARQAVLDRVPRPGAAGATATPVPTPAPTSQPAAKPTTSQPPESARERSSATVQSVLAVAGAGLFAVSAIVFTFFNPDLTDRALRSGIVGIITVLFLGGAWLLARRGLQFSAEAVGTLGMVFIALDVYAVSELAGAGISRWTTAAIGTLISGAAMAALSARARIRSWLWVSLLGLTAVPAMLGYAGGTTLTGMLGHLGAAFAAFALMEAAVRAARMFDGRLRSERVMLTALQLLATTLVITQVWRSEIWPAAAYWLAVSATLGAVTALATLATRHLLRQLWSVIAGAAATAAVVVLPFALGLGSSVGTDWYLAVTPAAGAIGLVLFGALTPTPRTVARGAAISGVVAVAAFSVLAPMLLAVMVGAVTVLGALTGADGAAAGLGAANVIAVVIGLASMAAGFGAFATIHARMRTASSNLVTAAASVTAWLAALAGLTFSCLPTLPLGARITVALALAIALSVLLVAGPRIRSARTSIRLPLILGAHFAVLLAGIVSWTDRPTTIWAGAAIVVTIAIIARTVPARMRFLHVGAGYAYALIIFAAALDQVSVGTIALLCLTTSLASIGAMAATFLRQVAPPAWYAILAVTSVPFVIGVVQVVFERSGWTALSTGLIFLLALTLLTTRRAGLGVELRAIAAGLLVPSLAVVVVCLGAQVLLGSASPVTLPVIAAMVALVLPSADLIRSGLQKRDIGNRDAVVARIALEASTLLTGAIVVVLALVRVAAGLPTTFVVLVILGVGAAATSIWAKRRYGWWVAGASFTGALWCLWALAGISVLEPYLLPPSLAAAAVGLVLTSRGTRAVSLYASGLLMAVAPILAMLAVSGNGASAFAPWRGFGLIAASWLLLGLGMRLGRGSTARAERLRALQAPTLWVALGSGAAGAIQGVRFGMGADTIGSAAVPEILLCCVIGVAGALPAAAAARMIRGAAPAGSRLASTRWLYAPAAAYVAVASWTAIERDWFTIWAMWVLMLAYLVAVVVIARRQRGGSTGLPPVWFVFLLAFVTSIVAWSPRELRVETFSLPLGIFLLAAGALAMRAQRAGAPRGGTLGSWPEGFNGSWPLLAPGLVTMLLASIVSTFTDPLTWRAILVIVIALVAILVGSGLRLAAPFLIGIVVLPIENAFVFLVQIGRGIESMPWWITLAVVGAVLLIIAVTYERRAGEENSITARLRDLS